MHTLLHYYYYYYYYFIALVIIFIIINFGAVDQVPYAIIIVIVYIF